MFKILQLIFLYKSFEILLAYMLFSQKIFKWIKV